MEIKNPVRLRTDDVYLENPQHIEDTNAYIFKINPYEVTSKVSTEGMSLVNRYSPTTNRDFICPEYILRGLMLISPSGEETPMPIEYQESTLYFSRTYHYERIVGDKYMEVSIHGKASTLTPKADTDLLEFHVKLMQKNIDENNDISYSPLEGWSVKDIGIALDLNYDEHMQIGLFSTKKD